jgi:hypothetical protein
MFVFEFCSAIFKFYTILRPVPSESSFGPFLTKSVRLINRGDKDDIDGGTQQIKSETTDQQVKQKKKL